MIRRLFARAVQVFWLLPGFLLWASFPPMGERSDVLFALAPLMWLTRRGTVKANLKAWFLNGFLFWIATLSWMPAIVKNGGPWPLVVLGWACLAAYCAAFFVGYGWVATKMWSVVRERAYVWRLAAILLGEPILFAGFELLRSRLFGGFAWNQLGVVAVNTGFGEPAALGGVYLLTMVIVLINGTFASIAERVVPRLGIAGKVEVPRWARSVETLLPVLVILGIYWMGARAVVRTRGERQVSVAMVQRNFPCVFKEKEENPIEVYSNLLVRVAPMRPELVVLSESAMCEVGRLDRPGARRFADWVRKETGARGVLAGGSRADGGKVYNSVGLFGGTNDVAFYDKVHLVPFGEFIPGDKMFPVLQKLAPVGSCTPGELKVLNFDGVKVGVAICFEDTDSAQIRKLAAMGAQVLVFVTNDSWFSESDETEQHAWQAVARAIETGLPVVRVGNSGVTGSIESNGRATWLVDGDGWPLVDAQGTMVDRVQVAGEGAFARLTPYVRFGDVPLFVAFLICNLCVFLVQYRSSYRTVSFRKVEG